MPFGLFDRNFSENGLPCSKLLPPCSSRGGDRNSCKLRFSLEFKLPGVFTSAEKTNASALRMVTATGRPTGRPTAAAADRPTADRRGTRCAPQIARHGVCTRFAWRSQAAGTAHLETWSQVRSESRNGRVSPLLNNIARRASVAESRFHSPGPRFIPPPPRTGRVSARA